MPVFVGLGEGLWVKASVVSGTRRNGHLLKVSGNLVASKDLRKTT